jgi:ABC-type xylose transport system permease subunit
MHNRKQFLKKQTVCNFFLFMVKSFVATSAFFGKQVFPMGKNRDKNHLDVVFQILGTEFQAS